MSRAGVSARILPRAGAFLLAVLVVAIGLWRPAWAQPQPAKDQSFQTAATQALLLDMQTGAVLFEKAADQPFAPASMAKIMTAAVVFEELRAGRLHLDDEFKVSENAWRKGGAPAGGSAMFAALNSRVRVEDLLQGLLVQSGNDAAMVLAEGIAGSEANFAGLMNRRARDLGLETSTFTNSPGLPDPDQKVTARELAALAKHLIETYPDYYRYFSQREFTWNKIRQLNRNPLITMDIGADGLITGYVEDSGFSLTASAVQNGQRLILVISGLKSARDRSAEAHRILEWGFRSFELRELFADGAPVGEASVYGGASGHVPLLAKGPVRILVPRGSTERVVAKITYRGPLVAPVTRGAEVGRLRVTRGETQALDLPLYTADDVATGSLHSRAFDAALELGTGFIRRTFRML